MPTEKPRVAAVVLNWNTAEETIECVRSLEASEYSPVDTIVVDNASKNDSVGRLREELGDLELICNPTNLGYAGGNNVGIRRAIEIGADYVLIVNSDVTVAPDTIGKLVNTAGETDRIAAVGPAVFWKKTPEVLFAAYGKVDFSEAIVKLVGANSTDVARFGSEPREVDWVVGCAVLLSNEALNEVGLFDEEFFAYHEEADWCVRAKKRGFKVVFVPGAKVLHVGQAATGGAKYASAKRYFVGRNSVLFARKHASCLQWCKFLACFSVSLPLAYLRELPRGQSKGAILKLQGFIDGLRGRKPPLEKLGLL